jgi:tetratricopeptide (TPR) repeat protein
MDAARIASEHFFEGLRALNDGELNLAEKNLLKALELVPDRPSVLTNLSIVYAQQNKLPQALDLAQKALKKEPNEPLFWLQQGAVQIKLRDYDGALSSLDRALEKNPSLAEAHNNRGGAFKELNRLDEALASYDVAISLKPDYAEAYSNRGIVLKELDRLDEALVSHDKAISLKPDNAEAYSNRGVVLKELDRLDEALVSYDKAISLKVDYAEAYSNRGNTLKELNRLDEALASYEKAIILKPNYANAHIGKGSVYRKLEEWEGANISFEAALRHEPTNNPAIAGLSLLPPGSLTNKRIQELLEIPVTVGKDQSQSLFIRANLLARAGDYIEAFCALEKANQLRVTDGNLKSKSWREDLDRLSIDLNSWKPTQFQNSSSHSKLLVLLGPSRSGKTTLEGMLCSDKSLFRGFESCSAGLAIKSLRSAAKRVKDIHKNKFDLYSLLVEILFPTHAETLVHKNYRLHTITNPSLLPAVPAIADIYEDAYFVFVCRNSIDNAAEIFAKDYSGRYSYAYQASTALEYVDRYNKISKQLALKLGSRALEVKYEDVVQTPREILIDIYKLVELEPSLSISESVLAKQTRSPESPFREQFARLIGG